MIETLFNIILLESVLGGGGRTFSIGPIGLRIVLFVVGLLTWTSAVLFTGRQRDGVSLAGLLIVLFFVSMMPGLLQDADQGTPFNVIASELQPLLFWLSAPLFAMALQTETDVRRAKNIILYGGVAVAATTLYFMLGIQYGLIGLGTVYAWASRTDELFFRSGNTFFYKGHFYVGVALVFCLVLLPRWWKVMLPILGFSIALSLTRGLYLAVIVAGALSFLSTRRSFAVIATVIAAVGVFVFYGDAVLALVYDPTRLVSSETRVRDLAVFRTLFDYKMLLFGEGTGVFLNGRRSVENSYVWAIWRFGILGLLFVLTPLYLSIRYYIRIPFDGRHHQLASAFFFGMIMLYVLTLSNPFVNNSIGMSYALCSIFALRRLSLLTVAEEQRRRYAVAA